MRIRAPKRTRKGLEENLAWQKEILRRVRAGESLETMNPQPFLMNASVEHWEKAVAESEAELAAFTEEA